MVSGLQFTYFGFPVHQDAGCPEKLFVVYLPSEVVAVVNATNVDP